MIKLRVEWHSECTGCGTELVTDFFDDSTHCCVCPWCGCECEHTESISTAKLKERVRKAVKRIEEEVNGELTVSS